MKNFIWGLLVATFLISLSFHSFGQERGLIFNQLTLQENLISQKFNDNVYTDRKGTVWIGSIEGLNRYEGGSVLQTLSGPFLDNKTTLAEPNIQSGFFEDSMGNIWFNTTSYLHRFDSQEGTFTKFSFRNTSQGQEKYLELIFLDSVQQRLWIASENKLCISALDDPTYPIFCDSIPTGAGFGPQITQLENSDLKFLFIPTDIGCEFISISSSEESLSFERIDSLILGYPAHTLLPISDTQVLIGTDSGLIHMDLETRSLHPIHFLKDSTMGKIIGIHPLDGHRFLIASASAEFFIYHSLERQIIAKWLIDRRHGQGVSPEKVRQTYLDKDQTLWLTSESQGIFFVNLNKRKFSTYLRKQSGGNGPVNDIIALTESSKGNIWCLTSKEILVLDPYGAIIDTWAKQLQNFSEVYGQFPYFIYCDDRDRIWICSSEGLFVFLPDSQTYFSVQNPEKDVHPTFLTQFNNGDIWVASVSGIWQVIETQSSPYLSSIFPKGHMDSTLVSAFIHEWIEGKVVVNSPYQSIQVYSNKPTTVSRDTTFELPYMVNGVAQDLKDSSLWLTTSQGLFHLRFTMRGFQLEQNEELPLEPLMGIIQENDSTFWISSLRGLIKYRKGSGYWRYGLADGLAGLQFQFWAYLKHSRGVYLFGGVDGITYFTPTEVQSIATQARPTLSAIWINDTLQSQPLFHMGSYFALDEVEELTFPYSQNTLSFRFAAREYSDPGTNHYRFQLVGIDDTLVNLQAENFVRYPNLPPNTYILRLEASNSDGEWSPEQYELKFIVTPPWYKTWWFYTLVFSVISWIAFLLIRFRIRNARKEAEYKQQVAEIETAVLKLQMNPHFIFNSLGSVQNYLSFEDTETASQMLKMFTILIRKILNYSEREYVSLSEEIDLLKEYVSIESMRFQKKVDFQVTVDPALDPEETLIPPMILQPFVENTFKHGISSQTEETSRITLSFAAEKSGLLCILKDNGMGRDQATKRLPPHKKHISKATEITSKRLSLLQEKEQAKTQLEIIDLKDETGRGNGTEVRLTLPLIQ